MKYNSALTRERINRAALKLFVAQGVDATTTKQIALTAGVAEGSLYRHYKSKQALISGLYSEHHHQLVQRLEQLSDSASTKLEKLNFMIEAVFFRFCQPEGRDEILFLLLAQRGEALTQRVEFDTLAVLVEQTLREGQAEGEFSAMNPVLAGALIIGMVAQCIEYLAIGAELNFEESILGVQQTTAKLLEV